MERYLKSIDKSLKTIAKELKKMNDIKQQAAPFEKKYKDASCCDVDIENIRPEGSI
ncbi:hypothetical protein KM914_14235 [Virgibacillus pantothenticus]|uniref:hypothetical protein n=1 Tax=Virgibacillus pantothenticus TaxID=1473 RepID=UPI001C23D909|nr:hypothetical protein [Virgibacillus pantothenticus]MBU8567578.1 hypothetical protein [Virgibacillus pantothenticus]MBU8601366.1 hypothetical protein [Virgibacillus pantothenticus]MBU8636183.1 hypothetical protein [Virgibacillus pantothenticus]MBU8643703.1 hypothetical protein [Virgibacillus pantothenticus]MBU8648041.1 hypothetical protein [Virgibacillus pantothenticus]